MASISSSLFLTIRKTCLHNQSKIMITKKSFTISNSLGNTYTPNYLPNDFLSMSHALEEAIETISHRKDTARNTPLNY